MATAKHNRQVILARGRARRRIRAEPTYTRLVRERAGLSQEEMAKVLGVDRSAISRWENAKRVPRPAMLDRYAQLLAELEQ